MKSPAVQSPFFSHLFSAVGFKRGFLELEDGKIPESERTAFRRAREELIRNNGYASDGTSLWVTK